VGRSLERFEPPDPLLPGLDPGVSEPLCEGDMNVKRLRDGVLGVAGGRDVRVEDRGGVRGGSIMDVFAESSSPNISFLIKARYILSVSSSNKSEYYKSQALTPLSINFSCAVFSSRL